MNILSNTQAVAARSALNLSQAKVAKHIALSRAYLSQFESGKRILEDRWQSSLLEYYQAHGWNPETPDTPPAEAEPSSIKIRDGFQISAALEDSEIEELLNTYYENQLQIDFLASSEAPKGFFEGVSEERAQKPTLELLSLACQQDIIIRRLRGQNEIIECKPMPYREIETIGEYAGSLMAKSLGIKGDEQSRFEAETV